MIQTNVYNNVKLYQTIFCKIPTIWNAYISVTRLLFLNGHAQGQNFRSESWFVGRNTGWPHYRFVIYWGKYNLSGALYLWIAIPLIVKLSSIWQGSNLISKMQLLLILQLIWRILWILLMKDNGTNGHAPRVCGMTAKINRTVLISFSGVTLHLK